MFSTFGVGRRVVVGAFTFVGVAAFAGLVGCGAAPDSEGESSEQALPKGNLAGGGGIVKGGGHVIVDPPPLCYVSNEFPYSPTVTTGTNWCSIAAQSVINAPRAFDTSNVFEAQLQALGCTNSVSAVSGPTVPPGGTGFSYASCPDSCEVRALIHNYHSLAPIVALTSTVRITACSGTPAAGQVFAIWDPHCPSTCSLPADI